MPTYDYQCRSCGTVTEVIHSMLEDGPAVCERCGGELRRVLHPTGIIFRGSGFYKTDSRSTAGGKPAAATPPPATASGDGSGPATGDSAAKGEDGGKGTSAPSNASAGASGGDGD